MQVVLARERVVPGSNILHEKMIPGHPVRAAMATASHLGQPMVLRRLRGRLAILNVRRRRTLLMQWQSEPKRRDTWWLNNSRCTKAMTSLTTLLISSAAFWVAAFFVSARTRPITSAARLPDLMIDSTARRGQRHERA